MLLHNRYWFSFYNYRYDPICFQERAADTRFVELSLEKPPKEVDSSIEKPLKEVDSSIVSLFPDGVNGMLLLSGE